MKLTRVFCLLAAFLLLGFCVTSAPELPSPAATQATEPNDDLSALENVPAHIRMTFAGDCTLASYNEDDEAVYRFPKVYERSGSLTYPFDLVRHLFERDDLTVVNFEGTLTGQTEHANKAYFFKGPPEYAAILSASSIEAATLANNHSRDYFEQGFIDTKTNLQNAGVGVIYEEQPFVTNIQGVEAVIIGDNTAFLEDITKGEVAERVLRQIKERKREDNITVVNMHWGIERDIRPTAWQQKTARMWIDAGADLIVGHHPHLLQGIELYAGKYIVYSLGNFAFGGIFSAPQKETALLHVVATAAKNRPPRLEIAVTPCYVSSSNLMGRDGGLINNYQPMPVTGGQAEQVMALILQRSALLEHGVTELRVES